MYSKQKEINRQISNVEDLFGRLNINKGSIEKLKPLIERFEIRIPFIGQFSSGKSSIINALLGEKLLSTDITAETAIPSEVRHSPKISFSGCLEDGKVISITREQIEKNQLEALKPNGWLSIEMSSDFLANVPELVLVDLPGWDSDVEAHQNVIDKYIDRSLAYAVVVSAEEGTLRESLRLALKELSIHEKPVILVITKSHKRLANDVRDIKEQLVKQIKVLMGVEPLAVAVTSAHKQDIQELKVALLGLQKQAEEIFNQSILVAWLGQLHHAKQILEVLASTEFNDAEAIKSEIDTLKLEMEEFENRLQKETAQLEATAGPMLSSIRMEVENDLHKQIDSLASNALNGGNVANDIIGVARLTISRALKNDFEPTLQRYLGRLVDALPNSLDFDFNIKLQAGNISEKAAPESNLRWTDLSLALAPILATFTGPVAAVITALLPFMARIFNSGETNQNRQEAVQARQHEQAKKQIREAIAQAVNQIESNLQPVIAEQIKAARDGIAQIIAADRKDIEQTLIAKQDALRCGEAEAAAQREAAQHDLLQVQTWISSLA